MDEGTHDPRLREMVNDERARRAYAEEELANARREVKEWRKRARLAEKAARFSLRLLPRSDVQTSVPAERERPRPVYPALRAAASGAPDWLWRLCDVISLDESDEAALAGADLVVVGGSLASAKLAEWLAWPATQPLVAIEPTGELARVLAGHRLPDLLIGDAVLSTGARLELPTVEDRLWEDRSTPTAKEVAVRLDSYSQSGPRAVAQRVFSAAGLDVPDSHLPVTAVVVTKRPESVDRLVRTLAAFTGPRVDVALATHGFTIDSGDRERLMDRWEDRVRVASLDESWPLGRCMNHMLEDVVTPLWAKIDDDDTYGPRYLEEAVAGIDLSGADLVGKHTHFLHDSDLDETFLMEVGNENCFGPYVPGPTFLGRRRTWEEVPFAHRFARIDSTFVRGVTALGMKVYSTSRYEFVLGRGGDGHTWHVDRSRYAAKGNPVGSDDVLEQVLLPS